MVLWGVGRCGRRGPRGQESLDALSGRRHGGASSLGLAGRVAFALALWCVACVPPFLSC